MHRLRALALLCTVVGCAAPATATTEGSTGTGTGGSSTGAESSGPQLPTGTGEAPCYAGYEGCACTPEGLCLEGLQCLSDLCVEAVDGTTSTGAAESSTSTSSTGDGSSSGIGESSSSTGPEPCDTDVPVCEMGGSTLRTCVDGAWVESDCTDECAAMAYDSGTCDATTEQSCACVGPNDDACWLGALALCYCYQEYGEVCGDPELAVFYGNCVTDTDPSVACFGEHVVNGTIDCEVAINDCF